jgi:hypothetical protein
MAGLANIYVNFNYGEGHWVVSGSSDEFDDHETLEPSDVESVVSQWRLQLEHRGYQVTVHYPPNWPPDEEEREEQLDALFDD